MKINSEIINGNCLELLKNRSEYNFDLTFLDPPFNQGKDYEGHNDNMDSGDYWNWMTEICRLIFNRTSKGGCIYFMQREKNSRQVLEALTTSGWQFQNLIIWKKKTSAVPQNNRYGKQYQIIAFATKGNLPRVFNKLRIDPPLLVTEKYARENGMYVTDVWDDIRELTSGYFAGDEPLRIQDGSRLHKQQTPVQLLTRIILSSSQVGDLIFDPFAGTATTLIVAKQLLRNSIGVELNPLNIEHAERRLKELRKSDNILKFRNDYRYTDGLDVIWQTKETPDFCRATKSKDGTLELKFEPQ